MNFVMSNAEYMVCFSVVEMLENKGTNTGKDAILQVG